MENNQITISGVVASPIDFLYEVKGKRFVEFYLETVRFSGTSDVVRCVAVEHIAKYIQEGQNIEVGGVLRTRNNDEDGKRKLEVFVFVKDVYEYSGDDTDDVNLCGFLCKKKEVRETPGGKTICDFMIAVTRPNGKSDYVPCIAWGRNAYYLESCNIGDLLKLSGRFQSRKYHKYLEDGQYAEYVAYEVSTNGIWRA